MISWDADPVHLDRSNVGADSIINSVIIDHSLLRACRAGIITAGGRFGVSAAYLSGTPIFHLLDPTFRNPI